MKVFATLFIAVMSFAVVTLGSAQAEAKCGCNVKWKKCLKKAKKSTRPGKTPGKAKKSLKEL